MASRGEKIFVAVILIAISIGLIYWGYKYDQKLVNQGMSPAKALLYVTGGVIGIIALAGISHIFASQGFLFDAFYFQDMFMEIVKLAF
jgi:multisubunit Na+/H+ antiporter MnhB subunit